MAVELKPRFQKIHSRINRNKQLAEIIHFFWIEEDQTGQTEVQNEFASPPRFYNEKYLG